MEKGEGRRKAGRRVYGTGRKGGKEGGVELKGTSGSIGERRKCKEEGKKEVYKKAIEGKRRRNGKGMSR